MNLPNNRIQLMFPEKEIYHDEIAYAYEEYKRNHILAFSGNSSFVIRDHVTDSCFALRDIIGLKPLYYTFIDNEFFFATDIGTLFKESGLKKEPNLQTMRNVIYHRTIPYEETMYRNVKRLPPGHYMQVSRNGTYTITRYWKPERIRVNHKIGETEAKEKFLILLDKAIIDRIDDLKTTGFELSGGLDSSSVVAWVRHRRPDENVTVFSMNFKNMEHCDESEYIMELQKTYDLTLHNIATDRMDYKNEYNLEYNYKLNPYWPIFITYTMGFSIIEKAKQLGINTILTGQGGDQVLSGNLFALHEYFRRLQWVKLYKELKTFPYPKQLLKAFLFYPIIGEKRLKTLRSIIRRQKMESHPTTPPNELDDLYKGKSLAFKYDLREVLHSSNSALMENSYYHVAETHFGIEFRHPYFDRDLIEFMLTLPPWFKYSEGTHKILLRNAMEGILPEKIRQRKDKAEFSEVIRRQIEAIDLNELLDRSYLAKLGLIEQKKLDQYKDEYASGKMKSIVYFWQLINLEFWYRYNFIEN